MMGFSVRRRILNSINVMKSFVIGTGKGVIKQLTVQVNCSLEWIHIRCLGTTPQLVIVSLDGRLTKKGSLVVSK